MNFIILLYIWKAMQIVSTPNYHSIWIQVSLSEIYAQGKVHMHFTQSVKGFTNVPFETVPMLVLFIIITMTIPHILKADHWAFSLSTPPPP